MARPERFERPTLRFVVWCFEVRTSPLATTIACLRITLNCADRGGCLPACATASASKPAVSASGGDALQVGRRHEQQLRFLLARRCSLTFAVAYSTDIRRLLQLESKSLKLLALPRGIEPLFQP